MGRAWDPWREVPGHHTAPLGGAGLGPPSPRVLSSLNARATLLPFASLGLRAEAGLFAPFYSCLAPGGVRAGMVLEEDPLGAVPPLGAPAVRWGLQARAVLPGSGLFSLYFSRISIKVQHSAALVASLCFQLLRPHPWQPPGRRGPRGACLPCPGAGRNPFPSFPSPRSPPCP